MDTDTLLHYKGNEYWATVAAGNITFLKVVVCLLIKQQNQTPKRQK